MFTYSNYYGEVNMYFSGRVIFLLGEFSEGGAFPRGEFSVGREVSRDEYLKMKLYKGTITRFLIQNSFYFAYFLFENSILYLKIFQENSSSKIFKVVEVVRCIFPWWGGGIFLRRDSQRGNWTHDKPTTETMWEENSKKLYTEARFLAWFEKL